MVTKKIQTKLQIGHDNTSKGTDTPVSISTSRLWQLYQEMLVNSVTGTMNKQFPMMNDEITTSSTVTRVQYYLDSKTRYRMT